MKILLIDDHVHTEEKGAPLFNMEKQFLTSEGHKVYTIGFSSDKSFSSNKENFIVKENPGRFRHKISKFVGDQEVQRQIKSIIEIVQPHLIHCHLLAQNALNILKVIPPGIKVIQSLHGPNYFCASGWGVIKKDSSKCGLGISRKCVSQGCVKIPVYLAYKKLDGELQNLLKEKVDIFHCPSKQIEEVANHHGFRNTVHIELGLRGQFTSNSLSHAKYGSERVIFVGTMNPVKGIDYLLSAFEEVLTERPKAKLFLAGKGSHLEYYKDVVTKKGLNHSIKVLGFLKQEELIKLYCGADLCIVPSIWGEQFGVVGPEALACGTPVIGSKIGGIPEWLDKDYGWLVEPRNILELRDCILDALNDPEELKRKGNRAKDRMTEKYQAFRYCKELLELFEKTQRDTYEE